MIYREINPKTWSARVGLVIKTYKCSTCYTDIILDIPVQTKEYVGFEGFCKLCDPPKKLSYLKPTNPEVLRILNEM